MRAAACFFLAGACVCFAFGMDRCASALAALAGGFMGCAMRSERCLPRPVVRGPDDDAAKTFISSSSSLRLSALVGGGLAWAAPLGLVVLLVALVVGGFPDRPGIAMVLALQGIGIAGDSMRRRARHRLGKLGQRGDSGY